MTKDKAFIESHDLVAALKSAETKEYRGVTDLPWYLVAAIGYTILVSVIAIIGYSANWWGL